MPETEREIVRLSLSLPEKDRDRLMQIANEMDVSLAWVARRAVTQWLEAYERDPEHNPILRDREKLLFGHWKE